MEEININKLLAESNNSLTFRDHVNLLKSNWIYIFLVCFVVVGGAVVYSYMATDIYVASTIIKVTPQQGSLITSPIIPGARDMGITSTFIPNEIQTIYNRSIREKVAQSIIDSFIVKPNNNYALIIEEESNLKGKPSLKSYEELMEALANSVVATQVGDLDFIEISVESPSPTEAALIANAYAEAYQEFNLLMNRNQLTQIKETLDEQRKEKRKELTQAENNIKAYQLKGGVIQLDAQAKALIEKISEFESRMNSTKIEMSISEETLENLKAELNKKSPSALQYLESKYTEPYLQQLQEQIAKLETQRDFAILDPVAKSSTKLDEINKEIAELKSRLSEGISKYVNMISSSSPEEIKQLTQEIFKEQVKYQSLRASYNQLGLVLGSYEEKFNNLPGRTLDLARLEREREVYEKLYLILEGKYQEALINEQSIAGNVMVMNKAYPPTAPSKPNRHFIIILGTVIGLGLGYGFVYFKFYFDKTIKTPEDLEKNNIKFLTWIPKMKSSKNGEDEFLWLSDPDNIIGESFRALRTRIQFSKSHRSVKTILVTSSAPSEGKTMISINLAGSFARDDKKTIIVDCDLRKPRVHSVLKQNLTPGLSDYLFGKSTYENILRMSKLTKLDFIPAGTIHNSASEILNSKRLIDLFQKLKDNYEYVIIDSAPILAVADTEVISNFVDGSILVTSSNSTEIEWAKQSISLLKHDHSTFLGVVLNNYDFKFGYPSSYKYHGYYYSESKKGKKVS